MNDGKQIVIVGGGMAGATAAFALRDEGFEGRVLIVGNENEWPYERPPMSKGYLRGEEPLEKALVKPAAEYEAHDVELTRGATATAIDVDARRVTTSAGDLSYDVLILATGSEPRRLEVPGADLDGIHYLRDVTDADRLRDAAATADDIVVVGGGWVGSEVVASLRQLGRPVTFLTSRPRPLEHVLGSEVADVYRLAHLEHGVRLMPGRVARLGGRERVEWIETVEGTRLSADLIVVGIGAAPRVALAQLAGLRLRDGAVEVDDLMRTSVPDVYAIGDIASSWNPRYGRSVRVEHWDNAKRQGKAVATTIVGRGAPYDRVPYLYSDQYDVGMEYRGLAPEWDEVVVRGDLEGRKFHAFWMRHGLIAAAMNVNLWSDGADLEALVESTTPVDPSRLSDLNVPLSDLAAEGVAA